MKALAILGAVASASLVWGNVAAAAPPVPEVRSTDQSGGVTARNIGSVTQNYAFPLVQSKYTPVMKTTFTTGAQLYRLLKSPTLTDDQYSTLISDTEKWVTTTYDWLKYNLGLYQAERFYFANFSNSTWVATGPHDTDLISKRNQILSALGPLLSNLDQMMRDPATYTDLRPENPTAAAVRP